MADLTANETRLIEHLRDKERQLATSKSSNDEMRQDIDQLTARLEHVKAHERSHAVELQVYI